MKIRQGFVSNSSSSSFLLVATSWDDLPNDVQDRLSDRPEGNDYYEGGHGAFDCNDPNLIIVGNDEPYYIGFEIEERLENGENVPDMKEELKDYFKKKYHQDVKPEMINGEFGT